MQGVSYAMRQTKQMQTFNRYLLAPGAAGGLVPRVESLSLLVNGLLFLLPSCLSTSVLDLTTPSGVRDSPKPNERLPQLFDARILGEGDPRKGEDSG